MALDKATAAVKSAKNGSENRPASTIDANRRAAMLAADAPEGVPDIGKRRLYKPADYIKEQVNGVQRCWSEDANGKRVYSSPIIHGYPVDVIDNDGKNSKNGEFQQVQIMLLSPCFVMVGAEGERTEEIVEAGDMILVTATAAVQKLIELASHPTHVMEVWARPIEEKPMPGRGGHTIWDWSIKQGAIAARDGVGMNALPLVASPAELVG